MEPRRVSGPITITTSPQRGLSALLARGGGPEGNERITATNALVLLVLLAVEVATLLSLRSLLSVHIFLGLLLIPPVALKLGSVGWRFVRYYTRNQPYRLKGPPQLTLRLLAPPLVLTTVVLFATGVALIVSGPGGGMLLGLHKTSFILWLVLVGIHVLAYLRRVLQVGLSDWRRGEQARAGAILRRYAITATLVVGLLIALATIPAQRPWVHWITTHHRFRDR